MWQGRAIFLLLYKSAQTDIHPLGHPLGLKHCNDGFPEYSALGRHGDICSEGKNNSKLKTMIWRHSNASLTFDLIFCHAWCIFLQHYWICVELCVQQVVELCVQLATVQGTTKRRKKKRNQGHWDSTLLEGMFSLCCVRFGSQVGVRKNI